MKNRTARIALAKLGQKLSRVKRPRIQEIKIEIMHDESPDHSYLGKFTDEVSPEAFVRYGEHAGKQIKELAEGEDLPHRTREYRFFLPANTGEATGNPESPKQDWERMESLAAGGWSFIGIRARAEIVTASNVCQTLNSGGLWGIESDSSKEHLAEIKRDECANLRIELQSFGFSARSISRAIKTALSNS